MRRAALAITFILMLGAPVHADLADELSDFVGYYIHSVHEYSGTISGFTFNKEIDVGPYRFRFRKSEVISAFSPTIIILIHNETNEVLLVIDDGVYQVESVY